jgi:hypothetical protein
VTGSVAGWESRSVAPAASILTERRAPSTGQRELTAIDEADLRVELSARRTAENVDLSVMDLNEAASEPQLTNVQVRKFQGR